MGPDEWAPQRRAVNHDTVVFLASSAPKNESNVDSNSSSNLGHWVVHGTAPPDYSAGSKRMAEDPPNIFFSTSSSYECPLHHLASSPHPIITP